jgi:hypothetical protein
MLRDFCISALAQLPEPMRIAAGPLADEIATHTKQRFVAGLRARHNRLKALSVIGLLLDHSPPEVTAGTPAICSRHADA